MRSQVSQESHSNGRQVVRVKGLAGIGAVSGYRIGVAAIQFIAHS